jgi:maltose phosphorylase
MFWFENDFTAEELKRHFDFYEPLTVHESSLSPCVHSILAAKIGYEEKSYEMYLRTARLDLDDYNNDTDDGLHITSMGGTWMAFVIGFGGVRVKDNRLIFHPFLPKKWESWSFRINFRGAHLEVTLKKGHFTIVNHSEKPAQVEVWKKSVTIEGNSNKEFEQ